MRWLLVLSLLVSGCSFVANNDLTSVEEMECREDAQCKQGWTCSEMGYCQLLVSQVDLSSDLPETTEDLFDAQDDNEADEGAETSPLACEEGFGDCNLDPEDDCEVDLSGDPNHCGGCGLACAPQASCIQGVCLCAEEVCPQAGEGFSSATCEESGCALACDSGWANCNNDPADGCEIEVHSNPESCGACGVTCAEGALCQEGSCRCEGDAESLCPNTGNNWEAAHCEEGICILDCKKRRADCNQDISDGCEINTKKDDQNCGSCGHVCHGGDKCDDSECD